MSKFLFILFILLTGKPCQWTVYCVQFPRSRTFHLDTAAWNCHTRVDIPWQQLPLPVVFTAAPIPFHCTNPNCIWFAVPYRPKGQYLICHRFIGTFLYDQCIVCFLSRFVEQAFCKIHTAASSYPELHGCMFIDNEGNVAVATAHNPGTLWLKFSVQVTSSRAHLLQRRVLVTA